MGLPLVLASHVSVTSAVVVNGSLSIKSTALLGSFLTVFVSQNKFVVSGVSIEGVVELYRRLQVATNTSLNGQLSALLQAVNMLGTGLFAGGSGILGGSLSVVGGGEMSN